jgi:excisionase family DNA binding protein
LVPTRRHPPAESILPKLADNHATAKNPGRRKDSRHDFGLTSQWLSLGPASRLLGVDPDTLRRWADEGRIEAYVTPGRHRRFDRASLERLAAARQGGGRPLASLGAGPERLTRAYRRRYAAERGPHRLVGDDARELERFREDGRRLVEALIAHLDADQHDAQSRDLTEREAVAIVDDLARRMSASGASLTDAVGLFVASRKPFMTELAGLGRRRALDATRLARHYDDASGLLDRLLLRLVDTYQEAAS